MTRPIADEWRRTWRDGHSQLTAERDIDGRISISVHDIEHPGYAVHVTKTTAAEIAAFIRGDK